MMHALRIILIITILINTIVVVYSARKIKHGIVHVLLFIHILAVVIWGLFMLLNMYLPDITGQWEYTPGTLGYLSEQILFAGATLWLSSQLWFVKLFPNGKLPKNIWSYWSLAFAAIVLVLCFIDNTFFTKITVQADGWSTLEMGPLTNIFTFYSLLHLIWPNVILFRRLRKEKNLIIRSQFKILFVSYVIFHMGSFLMNWVLPVYFQIYFLNTLGPAFSLTLISGMSYASNHYRLLDLRLSLQRTLTYITSGGIVLVMILYLVFAVPATNKINVLLIDTITILTAIISFQGFKRIFSPLFNLLIFQKTKNYLEIFRKAAIDISSSHIDMKEAVHHIISIIQSTLGIKKCTLAFQASNSSNYIPVSNGESYNEWKMDNQNPMISWFSRNESDVLVKDEIAYDLTVDRYKGKDKILISTIRKNMEQQHIAVAIPLMDENKKLIAVLLMQDKIDRDAFSSQEIRELRLFLSNMTFYIHNAHQFNILQKSLQDNLSVEKEFTKGLFHEVHTPLTIAHNAVEAIAWAGNDEEKQSYIGQATSHIQKSSKILNHFADIIALEQKKTLLYCTFIPLNILVNTAIQRLQHLIEAQNISINLPSSKSISTVLYVDMDRMVDAFYHIFHNAVVFNKRKRGKKIVIECIHNTKTKIILRIIDNGPGINDDDIKHVFEKFYRGDKSKDIAMGPGLGLSYAKTVIEAHGGNITITNNKTAGTTVDILLPLVEKPKKTTKKKAI